jgi:tRNA pseudouridine13 synthase
MRTAGLPNRFGEQRFGRGGDNATQALAILRGESRVRDRRHARFLLSALQSAVFNDVLAERRSREGASIDRLELGDIAWIHTSRGQFLVEDLEREAPRAATFEISPTGPIFGTKTTTPGAAVAEREDEILRAWGVDVRLLNLPPGIKLRGTRRPLRVCPEGARAELTDDGLWLHFSLPPGSYATVLVEELWQEAD